MLPKISQEDVLLKKENEATIQEGILFSIMEVRESFQTVDHCVKLEQVIKKSRFIILIQKIESESEVRSLLKEIQTQYPDATHHCWAYRLGYQEKEISQFSDGGEPSHSAGLPILQAIKQEKLSNVLVVVVRYFGGIKLGRSGLVKAYRDMARFGLQKAGKRRKYAIQEFFVEGVEYKSLGAILQAVESISGKIEAIKYGEKVNIVALLPTEKQKCLKEIVNNATQGEALIKIGDKRWINS